MGFSLDDQLRLIGLFSTLFLQQKQIPPGKYKL